MPPIPYYILHIFKYFDNTQAKLHDYFHQLNTSFDDIEANIQLKGSHLSIVHQYDMDESPLKNFGSSRGYARKYSVAPNIDFHPQNTKDSFLQVDQNHDETKRPLFVHSDHALQDKSMPVLLPLKTSIADSLHAYNL